MATIMRSSINQPGNAAGAKIREEVGLFILPPEGVRGSDLHRSTFHLLEPHVTARCDVTERPPHGSQSML